MLDGLKNLLSDAHGIAMLALIVSASALTGFGKMTVDQWTAFAQWIFAAYMGGHAVITATNAFAKRNPAAPVAPAEPAAAPEAPAAPAPAAPAAPAK